MNASDTPSAFPFEGSAYDIPRTRPPLRRIELDDWEQDPEPAAHKHGDPIMRAVTAAALVIAVVFLSAATTHSRYSPHVILGCFAAALATAAIGWAAYAITDRKAAR